MSSNLGWVFLNVALLEAQQLLQQRRHHAVRLLHDHHVAVAVAGRTESQSQHELQLANRMYVWIGGDTYSRTTHGAWILGGFESLVSLASCSVGVFAAPSAGAAS